jgi:hypothetical protein
MALLHADLAASEGEVIDLDLAVLGGPLPSRLRRSGAVKLWNFFCGLRYGLG